LNRAFSITFDWMRNKLSEGAVPVRIAELKPDQLARPAFKVFLFAGRHQAGAQLIDHVPCASEGRQQ